MNCCRLSVVGSGCCIASMTLRRPQSHRPRSANSLILRREGKIASTRGGNDDAVRWIAVKGPGQFVQRENDGDVERNELHDGGSSGLKKPCIERHLEMKAASRMKHLSFPQADCRKGKLSGFGRAPKRPMLCLRESVLPGHPPDPDVSVEQHGHRLASKSLSSRTDSSGAARRAPVPSRASHGRVGADKEVAGMMRATTFP